MSQRDKTKDDKNEKIFCYSVPLILFFNDDQSCFPALKRVTDSQGNMNVKPVKRSRIHINRHMPEEHSREKKIRIIPQLIKKLRIFRFQVGSRQIQLVRE